MKDSGIEWLQAIPEHWSVGRLGIICSVKARLGWKGLKASEYVDEGFVLLSTPNIKGKSIDFEHVNFINADRYFESPEIMLEPGDVLLAKDGSTLGIANVVRELPRPATVNSSLAVLRPRAEINSVYLYYFICSNYMQNVIQRIKDGMGVPHLFQADIRKFNIILPEKQEQKSIARFLDQQVEEIDRLINNKVHLVELLQEKRQALITHAVTKSLERTASMRETGIEWLGKIPGHWKTTRLKHVADYMNGFAFSSESYVEDGVPIIRIGDIAPSIDWSAVKRVPVDVATEVEGYRVCNGDVLVALTGATIGKSSVYDSSKYALLNQRVGIIRSRTINPEFLSLFVKSDAFITAIDYFRYGGAQDNIGKDEIQNVVIPVPPSREQEEIARMVNETTENIDRAAESLLLQIEKITEYRQTLISAAVTGKIDVRQEVEEGDPDAIEEVAACP